MKWLVVFLLVVNLAVAGGFLGLQYRSGAPPVAQAPLNVDRLSLRSSSRTQVAAPRIATSTTSPTLCVEWRGLDAADFARAREQLKGMTSDHVMSFTEIALDFRQWVIFPPLPSRAAAQAKLAELTAVGIQDIYVVKTGVWAHALSLGLYANIDMARQRVRELEEKGVYGIRVEAQPKQGTAYYFVIRSDDANALKSLNNAKTAYPNSALSRVACTGAG